MKTLVTTLLILISASAAQACLGEAQLIAPVKYTQRTGYSSCKAFIDTTQVKFFAESRVCPLSLAEIANEGIEVGFMNGHDCRLDAGDVVNGVIARGAGNILRID